MTSAITFNLKTGTKAKRELSEQEIEDINQAAQTTLKKRAKRALLQELESSDVLIARWTSECTVSGEDFPQALKNLIAHRKSLREKLKEV